MSPRNYVKARAKNFDVDLQLLLGDGRNAWLVDIRRKLAIELRERNFSLSQIGSALNRDHSTIVNLLRKREAH